MSYNRNFFFDFKSLPKPICVNLPNSQKVKVSFSGLVRLFSNLVIHNILFVPSFHFNLLSVHKLCVHLSNFLFFTSSHCFMQGPSMKSPMFLGESKDGLYILENKPTIVPVTSLFNFNSVFNSLKDVASSLSCIPFKDVSKLWHVRLRHMPLSNIQYINKIPVSSCSQFSVPCSICLLARQHKLPFSNSEITTK